MKIGIFGRTKADNKKVIQTVKEIGALLADKGHAIVTGGTEGYPHIAAEAAINAGGKTISYAVGLTLDDHKKFHNVDLSRYTEVIFQKKYFDKELMVIDNYLRSLQMCLDVDAAIIVGGRVGTMYEITLLSGLSKNIYILKNSGGITHKTVSHFKKEGHKEKSLIEFFGNKNDLNKLI